MRSWGGRVLDHRILVRVVKIVWRLFEDFGVSLDRLSEFIGENLRWDELKLELKLELNGNMEWKCRMEWNCYLNGFELELNGNMEWN